MQRQDDLSAAEERDELERLVQDGKLRMPTRRSDAFPRSDLIRRAMSSGARIVSVVAPAGHGKSTLLTEWASQEVRRTAWLRVDASDDDPAALLALLARSMAGFSSVLARTADLLAVDGADPLGRGAPLLAEALRRTEVSFALFLDDVHAVASPACADVLDVVLAAVPDGSAVVIASRHRLPFVANQRVAGGIFEIGADELRLGVEGARRIASSVGVEPSDEELEEWVRRSGGWPTGLFLGALIAREGGQGLRGDDHVVADYLYREVVAALPDDVHAFVLRSSVLGQLSAEVCDAVLGTRDAARLLSDLESRSLFLIRLDGRRGWYRYHDLFREFLHHELAVAHPSERIRLHRRAADWHEENGLVVQAIEHHFLAGDRVRAAGALAEGGLALYQRGEVALLVRWLRRLGDRVLERAPWALVIAAWVALLQGMVPEALRWTTLLHRLDVGSLGKDGPAIESQRAMVRAAMFVQSPEETLGDAVFAVASEPSSSVWRDQALHLQGVSLAVLGDAGAACPVLRAASGLAQRMGNPDSVLLSESDLAWLAIRERDWVAARRHSDAALEVVAEHHLQGYGTSAVAKALGARIAMRGGDLERAEHLLARGMRMRERTSHLLPVLAVQTRVHLAHTLLGMGDHTAAAAMLAEIDEVLSTGVRLGVIVDDVEELRARLVDRPERTGTMPLTPAELRLIPYLQTHLTFGQIAERLILSRNTVNSQAAAVYRKLGVGSRADAVEQAKRRGLLGS